jgi:hypothetical protein
VAFALIGIGLRVDIWSNGSFCLRGKRPAFIDSISSRNVVRGAIEYCYLGSAKCFPQFQIPFIPRRREIRNAPSEPHSRGAVKRHRFSKVMPESDLIFGE